MSRLSVNAARSKSAVWTCLLVVLCICQIASSQAPRNVIFLIGDGMGLEQVRAGGMYANGAPGTLSFESFPHQGQVTTRSANSSVTDSAAAGTALATGFKVNDGVISMAYPANATYSYGSEMPTLLELAQGAGKAVGLVSTTYITHATPAAFGAHEPARGNYSNIAADYLNQTRPDVLYGGKSYISSADAIAAGFTVVTTRAAMEALDPNVPALVSGQFGSGHLDYEYDYAVGAGNDYDTLPHLSQMTANALDRLDNDPNGLFLMVEGGRIDHAGHDGNIRQNVHETIEFANTVQVVVNWAAGRTDTLIIVTADHETGGLSVLANNGAGNYPTVSWSTGGHSDANVPVYAWGVNAEMISPAMDNTDLFAVITVPEPATLFVMTAAGLPVLLRRRRRRSRNPELASGLAATTVLLTRGRRRSR